MEEGFVSEFDTFTWAQVEGVVQTQLRQLTSMFRAGSGIGGHGNSELLPFFLGAQIVGPDLSDPPL